MKNNWTSNQNRRHWPANSGQSLVEFCITAPVLIALFTALAGTLALGWIQLEVSSLTQEFGVCLLQQTQEARCRSAYQRSLAQLPGSFRIQSIQQFPSELKVELRHRLPLMKPDWSFHEPVPRF